MDLICNLPAWQHFIIILGGQVIYSGLEFWLGKTEKTKSGSVIELIFNVVKLLATKTKGQ
jgi:hypothetical protein